MTTSIESSTLAAWREVGGAEPAGVEVLKDSGKSCVYRLAGSAPDGSDVIAIARAEPPAQHYATIYEILARLPVPALRCYAAMERDRLCVVFLEEVRGRQYSPFREDDRVLAGRWLASVHAGAAEGSLGSARERLPDRGPAVYLNTLREGRGMLRALLARQGSSNDDTRLLERTAELCDLVDDHWDEVESICRSLGETLVHGDFVPKHLIVASKPERPALHVLDWEYAGIGSPAVDLARSTQPSDRFAANADVAAYADAALEHGREVDVGSVATAATVGGILRSLVGTEWASLHLVSYWRRRPLDQLRFYEAVMAGAARELGWSAATG